MDNFDTVTENLEDGNTTYRKNLQINTHVHKSLKWDIAKKSEELSMITLSGADSRSLFPLYYVIFFSESYNYF